MNKYQNRSKKVVDTYLQNSKVKTKKEKLG